MNIDLVLDGKPFPVPKKVLLDFFEKHPCLFDESSYQVRSPVSVEHFEQFITFLKSKRLPNISIANARDLCMLSDEFSIVDLPSICSEFIPELGRLESPLGPIVREVETTLLSHSADFESFRRDLPSVLSDFIFPRLVEIKNTVEAWQWNFDSRISLCEEHCLSEFYRLNSLESQLSTDMSILKSSCDEFRRDIAEIHRIPISFPPNPSEPLNGIIADLTQKYYSNVQDSGAVSISSASESSCFPLRNVADFGSEFSFCSDDSPGQWICWEFRESWSESLIIRSNLP
jgi:hypothetical protein